MLALVLQSKQALRILFTLVDAAPGLASRTSFKRVVMVVPSS